MDARQPDPKGTAAAGEGRIFPFVVNGQTGALYGEKPWSWVKIGFASAAAALVLLLVYFLFLRGH